MSRTIGVNDFRAEVNSLLQEYGAEAVEAVSEATIETANEAKDKLKTAGNFKGTKYRGSWDAKKQGLKSSAISGSRVFESAVVYNKKHYRLTHLLEFGHAKQGGGRVQAFEHIAPVNDWAQEDVVERLERKLK